MEVTEKEIMEMIGKGEIYRQAAALHAKLAEVVYGEKATLYSCGCDLRVCVEFN